MKNSTQIAALTLCLIAAMTAQAQTIERVKLSDNDLTCTQIFGEIGQMDAIVAKANAAPAGAPAAAGAATTGAASTAGSEVAGAVAKEAINQVAARTGFGGFGGFGGLGGSLGGMFGNVAAQAAQSAVTQQAQQAAAQQAATQQAAAAQAQQGALLNQQAQGRKEHLTSLFLGKGCKMSDVQK